ncbi:MAG: hypothetical protein R3F59_14275 [Myxococcota bacterium]
MTQLHAAVTAEREAAHQHAVQRAANAAAEARRLARTIRALPAKPPPAVKEAHAALSRAVDAVRALATEAQQSGPPRDAELAEEAQQWLGGVRDAVEQLQAALAQTRRPATSTPPAQTRSGAVPRLPAPPPPAVRPAPPVRAAPSAPPRPAPGASPQDRAVAAVERATAAADRAAAIRTDLSIGRALRQAERAAASVARGDPAGADAAEAAAARAEAMLERLLADVTAATATLQAARPVHDEALAVLAGHPESVAAPHREALGAAWERAEAAARAGLRDPLQPALEEVRALAAKVPPAKSSRRRRSAPIRPGMTMTPDQLEALVGAWDDEDDVGGPESSATPATAPDRTSAPFEEGETMMMTADQLQRLMQRDDADDADDEDAHDPATEG